MENEFFFPPYIGGLYGKPNGFFNEVKVMAIGNNHHCDGFDNQHRCCVKCSKYTPACNNFTAGVVEDYISNPSGEGCDKEYKRWRPTYTKFANLFHANCMPEKVWSSIVFYNFLQCAVPNHKAQGNKAEISRSKPLVMKLLTDYAPDIVIVWGYPNVYQNLPKEEHWSNISERTGIYTLKGKSIRVACIDHPMICSYEKGREIIKSIAPELFNK